MAKVKLSIEVEPELRRRVKLAATSRDETVRQWIVAAIQHQLEREGTGEMMVGQPRKNPVPSAQTS